MEEYEIRRVRPGDEQWLARIQTESWKAGFRGILAPDVLERYTDPERVTQMYRRTLENHMGNGYLLEISGEPHCIAYWDKTRVEDMEGYAELICIHSLPGNWRRGYGSRMMERVLSDMREAGYRKVMLWVFRDNARARAFYEAFGFAPNGREAPAFGSVEIMYARDLEI